MKKAYLVSFSPMTRVVVDVDKDPLTDDMEFSKVIRAARERMILNGIDEYLCGDNNEILEEDEECPYDPETDDLIF